MTLTAERLRELLAYDPAAGVFTWRVDVRGGAWVKAGHVAGTIHSRDGYRQISICKVQHKAHRLAWLYVTGAWPSEQIDHVNGDRSDNRIANLREASAAGNARNARRRIDNVSGFKGAYEYRPGKWRAYINKDGRRINLGTFATPEEAHAAYVAAAQEHHGEFARPA
jgi:heme-degrading monooxygenase HmoA